ncbi:MAG: hypothetical protein PHY34_05065, partial [Patescibacteria group bacterium]|nr:hypothetical protein [Patescibacteria group bacterium]
MEKEIARDGSTRESVIELTDIGGPTLLRSAAKGGRIVIGDPADRQCVIDKLREFGHISPEDRNDLAAKAEYIVALYCLASARYRSGGKYDGMIGQLVQGLRYGENPWQVPAGLFSHVTDDPLALHRFHQVEGAPMGYVNFTDLDRLLITISHIVATFAQNGRKFKYFAVGVKHGNACGASFGNNRLIVLRNMIRGNPRAIMGGMVITNFTIDEQGAKVLRTSMAGGRKRILDGVFAPDITPEAINYLKRPKGACKMLVNPALTDPTLNMAPVFRPVRGGLLRQPSYGTYIFRFNRPSVQRIGKLTRAQKDNLLLAVAICQTSNSNTATIVKNRMLIGNGTTRPDCVDANELAVDTAHEQGHGTTGAVCVND